MPCPQCASHNGNLKIIMWVPFPPRVNNRPRLWLAVFETEQKPLLHTIGNIMQSDRLGLPSTDCFSELDENAEETFTSDQSVQENALIYSRQLQKNISMPACNGQVDFIVALVLLLLHYEWCRAAKTCGPLLWRWQGYNLKMQYAFDPQIDFL